MQVKRIAEHSLILSTFIMLQTVIKVFVLSIFAWPFTQVVLYVVSTFVSEVFLLVLLYCYYYFLFPFLFCNHIVSYSIHFAPLYF